MKRKIRKKKYSFFRKLLISSIFISIIIGFLLSWQFYNRIFKPNITFEKDISKYIFINTGSDFDDVLETLLNNSLINLNSFIWVAEKKNYTHNIKPGRYLLHREMSNNDLVNLLRSGAQDPIKITFNNIRTVEDFASKISSLIECDSLTLIEAIYNPDFLKKYNLNEYNVASVFIPNTYELFWNTSAKKFLDKMLSEYDVFWNQNRIEKAKYLKLKPVEVSVLASIVEKEQNIKYDERPMIAGLYLNRIKAKMRLESDPTLIFAIKDFTLKRVLNKDKKVKSPYNTYKHKGLPPGPICIPSINSIDAVLNAKTHDFIFMCAKEDFSGYHNFAITYKKHLKNAKKYQKMLSKRKIFR